MSFPVRLKWSTASVGSSHAPTDAVDHSAPSAIRPESTYISGKVVQTNGATSDAGDADRATSRVDGPTRVRGHRVTLRWARLVAVNCENSLPKVQNVRGDSSEFCFIVWSRNVNKCPFLRYLNLLEKTHTPIMVGPVGRK